MNEEKRRPAPPEGTLVERLRKEFGTSIDPGITLDPRSSERTRVHGESAARPPSTGVLSRLEARTPSSTRYRLDGEIARGGMGAILDVWDEDLRRHLAMKVALASADGEAGSRASDLDARVLSRFLEEAQVTGQLEHPGIVPVHELGLDEEGHLYFTMPLVRGRDLEKVFQQVARGEEGWTTTRALGVLLKACEAMAYAHDKGVIHRDLKPANVMVGRFGEVYVMDWGLARVQGHEDRHDLRVSEGTEELVATDRRTDATGESSEALYTMDGDVIGTPAYMAPEQARGELAELDARTDVYSLGAMLYRLFAGAPPYTGENELGGAAGVLTKLLEGPPRLLEEVASNVPPELVAVCEKAMARDSAERYADMSELAEDLRAFLENRVVQAYETGAWAESRKWIRRNKPLAGALAAGFLALVAGLVASLVLKGQADASAALAEDRREEAVVAAALAEEQRQLAEEQRQIAEEQRRQAEESARIAREERERADENAVLAVARREEAVASQREAERQTRIAREVSEFLNADILHAANLEGFGRDVRVRDVLSLASLMIESRFKDEPIVEAELRRTIAESFVSLGEYEKALGHAERSLELYRGEVGDLDDGTIRARRIRASALMELGRSREAIDEYRIALEDCREFFGEEHKKTLATMNDIGLALEDAGRIEEARDVYERVIELEVNGSERDAGSVAVTKVNYGVVLLGLGEFERAKAVLEEGLENVKRYLGSEHPNTIRAMNNLALTHLELGEFRESLRLHRKAIKLRDKVFGPDHPEVPHGLANLGTVYARQGRTAKARETFEEAAAGLERILGPDHPDTLQVHTKLAMTLAELGERDRALEMHLGNLDRQRAVLGPEHPETLESMNSIAVLYRDLGRYEESEDLYRETLAAQRRVLGPEHPTTIVTLENLGGVLFTTGRHEESGGIVLEVLELRRRVLGARHPDVGKTTYNLGMLRNATGRPEEAEALFEEAYQIALDSVGRVHQNTADAVWRVAELRMDALDWEGAAERFQEAIDIRRELHPPNADFAYLLHQESYARWKAGEFEAAAEAGEESLELSREFHGPRSDHTLGTMAVLSRIRFELGELDAAEALSIEYYEAKRELLGDDHPDVAEVRRFLERIAEAR